MVTKPPLPTVMRTWEDLSAVVSHCSQTNGAGWLFRGVTDTDYPLVPKVGRERVSGRKSATVAPYRLADELAVLDLFDQQARGFGAGHRTALETMALAQHFGAPTRMLDWTESVLVATWFAVQKPSHKKSGTAALWLTKGVPPIYADQGLNPMRLGSPHIYRPPHIAPRVAAQLSVMMVCSDPPTEPVMLPFVHKIEVPYENCFTLRKRLDAVDVNAKSLFADLGGVGQHLDWMYFNGWMVAYRRP